MPAKRARAAAFTTKKQKCSAARNGEQYGRIAFPQQKIPNKSYQDMPPQILEWKKCRIAMTIVRQTRVN
jgi:hypothetical protein